MYAEVFQRKWTDVCNFEMHQKIRMNGRQIVEGCIDKYEIKHVLLMV